MSKTGHIYKLCCNDPTVKEIYIGSTTNPRVRKCQHKSNCTNPNNLNHYNLNVYQYIRTHGGFSNWDMIILEPNIAYDEKHELRTKERQWLERLSASLNSYTPNRTDAEWREENREALLAKNKQWYEENKEYQAIKNKQWRENNKEYIAIKNKKYHQDNRESISVKMKQYHQDNRESLINRMRQYRHDNLDKLNTYDKKRWCGVRRDTTLARNKEKIECDCGAIFNRPERSRHIKTKKHKQYQDIYDYITS
jgi:hypothetical protein